MEERDLQLGDGSICSIVCHEIEITMLDDRKSCVNCRTECEKMGLTLTKATSHPMRHDGKYHIIDLGTETTPDNVHKAAIYKNGLMAFQCREHPLETGKYWIGYDPASSQIFIGRTN